MRRQSSGRVLVVDQTNQRIETDFRNPIAEFPAVRGRRCGTARWDADRLQGCQIRSVVVIVSVGR